MINDILKPRAFTRFCMSIAQVPASYIAGLTIDEQILWLCSYIEKEVIPAVNNNSEAVIELQELYQELVNYVDHYFDNLDVQEEINNKLDDMAEHGELADIIAQYITLGGVLAYDTKSDMKSSENLSNGSICKTLGDSSYLDGQGNFYKVREKTEEDIVDDDNIVELYRNDIIAEKIPYSNGYDLQQQINNITNKKWLIIGDSYCQGYSPDGSTTSYATMLKNMLGYDEEHWIVAYHGGASFGNPNSYLYRTIIESLEDDDTITDILIAGGFNDITMSKSDIKSGINNVRSTCSSKFPNAKIHCAFIGGTTLDIHGRIHNCVNYYMEGFLENQIDYWPNLQYIMFSEDLFASDKIHPNQAGQNKIARGLYQAFNNEFNYTYFADLTIKVNEGQMFAGNDIPLHLYSINNISYLSQYSGIFNVNSSAFDLPNNRYLTIGKLEHNYGITGTQYFTNLMFDIGKVIIKCSSGYYDCPCKLCIDKDSYVKLYILPLINDYHTNYQNLQGITQVQIPMFTIIYPTITM